MELLKWLSMRDVVKLLHAAELGVYVGICRSKMKQFSRTFQLLYQAEAAARITASVFNHFSDEVITTSPGKITVRKPAIINAFFQPVIIL